MPRVCTFQESWLRKVDYRLWLLGDKTNPDTSARCRCCLKSFDVSNMGESAIKSHMKGQKHLHFIANYKSYIPQLHVDVVQSCTTAPEEPQNATENPSTSTSATENLVRPYFRNKMTDTVT